MLHSMMVKKGALMQPSVVIQNNKTLTISTLDTKGFSWADIDFWLGTTDVVFTALKLQESNDDGVLDAYTDIVGSRYGTDNLGDGATLSVLPVGTDDNKLFGWHLDLRPRKRYLKVVATVSNVTGCWPFVSYVLSRAAQAPATPTQRGYAEEMLIH